ncbi:MAG: DUF3368 domain-containing protein [Verrucomicrobia bacterium]|nr:DUF3368 domain-containing protein [Verrucomicrobiota bacterium]
MNNKWAVNASPLILLAKIGQADLLPKLTTELVIPASVVVEIHAGPATDPAQMWLRAAGQKAIQPDPPVTAEIAAWDLGAGETAVLNWVRQHPDFEAILDDRAARKCAHVHNLSVRGTLGVILAAKVRRLLPAAKPVCMELVRAGFHIQPTLLSESLRLVGE